MGNFLIQLFTPVGLFFGGLFIVGQIALEPVICIFYPGEAFLFYTCPRRRTPVPRPTTPAPSPVPSPFNIRLINTGAFTQFNAEFQAAKERWEEIITNDLPDVSQEIFNIDMFENRLSNREPILEDVDDVTIGYELGNLGTNTIARSAPVYVRTTGTTITGVMRFDYRFFLGETETSRINLILREIGTVLGIGSLWSRAGCRNCQGPNRTMDYLCSAANDAYRNLDLGPSIGTGTLQLNQNCRYWSPNSFNASDYTDLMVPNYDARKTQLLTTVTLASLTDIGDYVVNFDAADPIPTS